MTEVRYVDSAKEDSLDSGKKIPPRGKRKSIA